CPLIQLLSCQAPPPPTPPPLSLHDALPILPRTHHDGIPDFHTLPSPYPCYGQIASNLPAAFNLSLLSCVDHDLNIDPTVFDSSVTGCSFVTYCVSTACNHPIYCGDRFSDARQAFC